MAYHSPMPADSINRLTIAAHQFHRARRQAGVEALLARLRGQPAGLLSYEEVVSALRIRGQSSVGLQQVPIDAIVGSVGRYNDFSRTFLPLQDADQDRWVSVKTAAPHVGDLPPVELYRIGDTYFVLDGNHRVSIARQQGVAYIDAYVTEVQTRAPLPPGASPDAMIIAAEYAAFLEWSRLDQLREDADLRVSVPGQYAHLENHIEAFRFVTEMTEQAELELPAAIERWYDEAYAPLAAAIRQQGILRYFPDRTETDFYIWLATHRIALQNELGIHMAPEVAAGRLLSQVASHAANGRDSLARRVRRRFTRLVVPDADAPDVAAAQAQSRAIARYTDQLFKDILVPVDLSGQAINWTAVRQALALAVEEDARLCVAGVAPGGWSGAAEESMDRLATEVERRTETLELPAECVPAHDVADVAGRLAPLYDLIILDRTFGAGDTGTIPSPALVDVCRRSGRPVWVAGSIDDRPVSSRIVVGLDASDTAQEALFVATYLAERRGVALAVFVFGSRRATGALAAAREYLALHEIDSEFLDGPAYFDPEAIARLATNYACDLLIVPGLSPGSPDVSREEALEALVMQWPHSLLLAAWG